MPKLGIGSSLIRAGLTTPGIVTDSLVLKHNYAAGGVVPVSDGAAFFDGTDDYITMGDVCDLGTADFSISFWAYFPEGTSQEFISKYEDDDNRWFLRSQGEDKLQFFANVGGSTKLSIIETTSVIAENTWQHIAFTCDRSDGSSGGKIYINGILTRQAAGDATDIDNDGNLEFGRQSTTEMGGYMCNFGIWSAVLTQPQIKSIMWKNYAGLTSSETENLVSWWNLDEALATDGTSGWVADNHDITFGSNITPTWSATNGSPTINGQVITLPEVDLQTVAGTVSAGVHKVNVTVTNYTGSNTIEMPWDGDGTSNMLIEANGTYEFYEFAADGGWVIYAANGRGCTITINSIQKADGNMGELT